MNAHAIEITITDDGHPTYRIVCKDNYPDKDCQSFKASPNPNAEACRCTDPTCPCRDDDHDDCGEFGRWIEEIGYECCAIPTGECWYAHQVAVLGREAIDFVHGICITFPIAIGQGSGWDEPTRVIAASALANITTVTS